jgi:hypothetical protein
VPQHPPAPLDKLLALAQGYAEFAMRNIGHVPPALLAQSPTGPPQVSATLGGFRVCTN